MKDLEKEAEDFYNKADPENNEEWDLTEDSFQWYFGKEEMIKFATDFANESVKAALIEAAEKATAKIVVSKAGPLGIEEVAIVDKDSILSLIPKEK